MSREDEIYCASENAKMPFTTEVSQQALREAWRQGAKWLMNIRQNVKNTNNNGYNQSYKPNIENRSTDGKWYDYSKRNDGTCR